MRVRPLIDDDGEQAFRLSVLAFGGDPRAAYTPSAELFEGVGAFDDAGRLVGKAVTVPYEQWWGGQRVPMCGLAGVAVHPDARGQGVVRQLVTAALEGQRAPVSVLFPTAPGIYRGLGWEVVGTLDDTEVPLSSLPVSHSSVRSARPEDLPALQALYDDLGRATNGLLTRTGPAFRRGPEGLLEHDVVSVVEEDGEVTGYVAYDRGRGYRGGAQLRVWECVASAPSARRALLGSLASWTAVADTLLWRGATTDLALELPGRTPAPQTAQPWMLRVLDAEGAVAARGFAVDVVSEPFTWEGKGYRLETSAGRGRLVPAAGEGHPVLQPRGLALAFAGVGQGRLVAAGLLDRPVGGLAEAFAGPPPQVLDYF